MALQQLELQNTFNQKFSIAVEVDDKILNLEVFLEYNRIAGYWVASITDLETKTLLISSMPLFAAQNLLAQYDYMKIGSCGVINISGGSDDGLNSTNLGTDFLWCWDDNV